MTHSRYIVNSAVIPQPGTYRYELIAADQARVWIGAGPWQSRIGYEATAHKTRA